MKDYLFAFAALLLTAYAQSQNGGFSGVSNREGGKNMARVGIADLGFFNDISQSREHSAFSIAYERAFSKKFTICYQLDHHAYYQTADAGFGAISIKNSDWRYSGEGRYYFQEAFEGLYIGPSTSYHFLHRTADYKYGSSQNDELVWEFGIGAGGSFRLAPRLNLNIGGNIGKAIMSSFFDGGPNAWSLQAMIGYRF